MIVPVKNKKDGLYLVDCVVTGSSDGTSKDPKCSLQRTFEQYIFTLVQKLVGEGGKYKGYKVVCQEDGVGPHFEAVFLDFIRTSYEREGCIWDLQEAQIPYINVLDLTVFSCISRCHYSVAVRKVGCMS